MGRSGSIWGLLEESWGCDREAAVTPELTAILRVFERQKQLDFPIIFSLIKNLKHWINLTAEGF